MARTFSGGIAGDAGVQTKHGEIPICSLKTGDLILTVHKRYRRAARLIEKTGNLVDLVLSDGTVFSCMPDTVLGCFDKKTDPFGKTVWEKQYLRADKTAGFYLREGAFVIQAKAGAVSSKAYLLDVSQDHSFIADGIEIYPQQLWDQQVSRKTSGYPGQRS